MNKYKCLPVDNKKILLSTTKGRYNDSPRAIAEYIHNTDESITIVWAYLDHKYTDEFPDFINLVRIESDEYYRELATSKVWIFNYLLPQGIVKRAEQIYIQTWHGDKGFKRFANDALANDNYSQSVSGRVFSEDKYCDYMLTGSQWFVPIYRRATGYTGRIIEKGLPRNDCLLNRNEELLIRIRKDLNLTDRKVLLFAPTFRASKADNGDISGELSVKELLDFLENQTGEKWVCLARAHGSTRIKVNGQYLDDERIINVSTYKDMADLLLVSDMLITDYSSCAGDFALTNKPILLYQEDISDYITNDRSLYFNMSESPYKVAHSMSELYDLISSLTQEDIIENNKQIRDFYKVIETGKATQVICDIIFEHIRGE